MTIYISVVSHNHAEMIMKYGCLKELSQYFNVVIKNNTPHDSSTLQMFCQDQNIHLIDDLYGQGFGSNNNIVFEYCRSHLSMSSDDLFIVLNPDVIIAPDNILKLETIMYANNIDLAGITLFKDELYNVRDYSIRQFPTLLYFILSFLGLKVKNANNIAIDTSKEYLSMDWAAGSFMALKVNTFINLRGFNERYHMYCEDIDLCYRAKLRRYKVCYLPSIKAIHTAQHQNRKILSRHFYWHLNSAFKFLISKYFPCKVRSIIK